MCGIVGRRAPKGCVSQSKWRGCLTDNCVKKEDEIQYGTLYWILDVTMILKEQGDSDRSIMTAVPT